MRRLFISGCWHSLLHTDLVLTLWKSSHSKGNLDISRCTISATGDIILKTDSASCLSQKQGHHKTHASSIFEITNSLLCSNFKHFDCQQIWHNKRVKCETHLKLRSSAWNALRPSLDEEACYNISISCLVTRPSNSYGPGPLNLVFSICWTTVIPLNWQNAVCFLLEGMQENRPLRLRPCQEERQLFDCLDNSSQIITIDFWSKVELLLLLPSVDDGCVIALWESSDILE